MLPPALTRAAGDVLAPEQRHHAIDGVALGDPAQVQLDAGPVEADRPRGRVEHDVRVSDASAHLGDLGVAREAAAAAEEPPGLHQGPDGDVERAAGLAA